MKKLMFFFFLFVSVFSCSKEKTKEFRSLNITTVKLDLYPFKNNGVDWDAFSTFPDPYFIFKKENIQDIDFQSAYKDEAGQGEAFWTTDLVCFSEQNAFFQFFDEDGATDDLIDVVYLNQEDLKEKGYPEKIVLSGLSGMRVVLTIEYLFQ